MKTLKLTLSCFVTAGLFACTSTPTKPPTQNPAARSAKPAVTSAVMTAAVLAVPSTGTSRLLTKAMSEALNGTKVNLAPDAFTKNGRLSLERNTVDPKNKPGLNGRLMGVPTVHRFALMLKSNKCYLVYQKTGKIYALDGVKCRPIR